MFKVIRNLISLIFALVIFWAAAFQLYESLEKHGLIPQNWNFSQLGQSRTHFDSRESTIHVGEWVGFQEPYNAVLSVRKISDPWLNIFGRDKKCTFELIVLETGTADDVRHRFSLREGERETYTRFGNNISVLLNGVRQGVQSATCTVTITNPLR